MKPLKKQNPVAPLDENKVNAALHRLVYTNLVAVFFTDLAGNILSADESFLKMLGYSSADLPASIHDLTPPEHHRLDEEAFEKLMAFGACAPFEKDLVQQDGTPVPVLFGAALHEEEIACFVVDMSQNKQTQEKLNHLAYHDALTDLPNQVLFKDRLKQAIALSRRNDQMQAVMLLNLDRFKTVNDSLGYTAGDRLLQSVAQRLMSCVRESDTVARFGSDEFAILLTQIPRAQDAANAAQAIKHSLDQAFLFEDQEIFVSSSIGISLYPNDGRDTAGLLKTAGAALDRAKVQGGGSYQFYTAGGTTRALRQLVLESNLRPGLERAEFFVQYQPQVAIHDFQLVGMEALIRWQHPSLGLLYPKEFIALAEESGMIISLGEWVMRTACAQNKVWQDAGLAPMCLSVNFSARQFQQPTFITDVSHILKETNLDPRWLELELTESSIMKDPERAIEKLHELKLMGIKVAVDDFGTGYSSLNYLKRFPIDTLKIDRSFVSDVCKDPHDTAIVRAIINLGHALDLTVIAEGVETKEQLQYLSALECDVVQGFLFSKALSVKAFEELLVEQRKVASAKDLSPTVPLSAMGSLVPAS
jgi:diguanylate cyclase (GGDEF)-like protein/PAS domain S-box-containing protein